MEDINFDLKVNPAKRKNIIIIIFDCSKNCKNINSEIVNL